MPKYEVIIKEELDKGLRAIANATGGTVEDLIQEFIDANLDTSKFVDIVIEQYKLGNLKAREAWKLSGLTYQEFQARATS